MILATKRQTSGFGAETQFKERSFPPVRRAIWQDLMGLTGFASCSQRSRAEILSGAPNGLIPYPDTKPIIASGRARPLCSQPAARGKIGHGEREQNAQPQHAAQHHQ